MMNSPYFSKNIFLAEDDEDDTDIFKMALNEVWSEASLIASKNGKMLMDLLDMPPVTPDVIFLDLNMPLKSGYECLKEIRADRALNVPVVILTTSNYKDDIEKLYELGANYFIVKPSSFPDLKQVIKKVLSINWNGISKTGRQEFVLKA